MKAGIYNRQLDTPDELLSVILDAAGCVRKRENYLRRTTRDLRKRVAKCIEVGGWDFRRFILNS
jgi:hypothetical protein